MKVLYTHDVSHEPERWFNLPTMPPTITQTLPGTNGAKVTFEQAVQQAVHYTIMETRGSNRAGLPIVTEFTTRIREFGGAKIVTRVIPEGESLIILGRVKGATNGKIIRFWGLYGDRDDFSIEHPYCLGMSCWSAYQFWDDWLTCGVVDGRVLYYLTDGYSDDFSVSTVDAIAKWSKSDILKFISEPLLRLSKLNQSISYLVDVDGYFGHLDFNRDEELSQLSDILRKLIADKRIDPIAINAFHNSQIISMRLMADVVVT